MHRYFFMLSEITILLYLGTQISSRRLVARLENAALNKPTVQGPQTHEHQTHVYESSFAVDGNPSSLFPDCAAVGVASVMWWIVDLKRSRKIHTVLILPRQSSGHKMKNFTVDMFDEDPRQLAGFPRNFGEICATQVNPIASGQWHSVDCAGIMRKRYVRVVKHGYENNNYMSLCEVEVLVEPMNPSSGHAYKISSQTTAKVSSKTYAGTFDTAMSCAVALAEDTEHTGFQFDTETGQCFVFDTSPLTGDAGVESSATWTTYTVL